MIKFIRKIRQKLLTENKINKYLFYAIGEIVLVVIGILIALSINNWNDDRKDQKIESNYLSSLRKDLIADTTSISLYLIKHHQENIGILKLAKKYNRDTYNIRDTINFVENLHKILGPWKFTWTLNTSIFNELASTGNLRKIRDRKLRQELSKYYSRLAMVQNISDKSEGGYRNFITANLYYDTELDKLDSDIDYRHFLSLLKEDSFYELCNLELSYAHVMYYWAKQVKERGTMLLEMLDEYSIN